MRRSRGQALVLFSLLMLCALVMSFMTLALNQRAKERLELQMAADHAAWNNAVATAYSMNGAALMVRTQVAHFVAVAAVQSLVSFAGAYRGYLNGVEKYYREQKDVLGRRCTNGEPCGCTGRREMIDRLQLVTEEHDRIKLLWPALDLEAGMQIYGAGIMNLRLLAEAREVVQEKLVAEQLQGALLANTVARAEAGRGRSWRAVSLDRINLREVGGGGRTDGAVLGRHVGGNMHGVWAVMGSRGNPFVTARDLSHVAIESALRRVTGSDDPVVFGHQGSSYFSERFHGHTKWEVEGYAAWADDHGVLGMRYVGGGCNDTASRIYPVTGMVKSTDLSDDTDEHLWSPRAFDPNDPGDVVPGSATHTASICTNRVCPAMFFAFQDYNQMLVANEDDVFGQPKNYAALVDERTQGPDPWNLLFRFQLAKNSGGAELKLRERGIGSALSAGMAYYHRRAHFKEPPNLFNPFWRAGLVRADVDEQGRLGDLADAYRAADPVAGESFERLYAVGYRGIP